MLNPFICSHLSTYKLSLPEASPVLPTLQFFFLLHNTKDHAIKLTDRRFRAKKKKYFFTQGIINIRNSPSYNIEITTSLNGFKGGLDIDDRSVTGYLS